MRKPKIHDDDYNDLEYEHSNAMHELESLSIADFGMANGVLMAVPEQDRNQ